MKITMTQAKTVETMAAILAIMIALTVNVSSAQTSLALKADNNTLECVPPGNVLWAKTYGGAADDRAFYALTANDGYLVVGSSRSIVSNTIVGWVLKLDGKGDVVWNKTFLEGWGTEVRYAVNLTDGYLLVGNQFFPSGQVSGYVARLNNQGDLQWMKILVEGSTCKLFSGISISGGFVFFGLSSQSINGASLAWAVKLDQSGNVVWSRTYGGSIDSAARSGVLTKDGDYLVAGYSDSIGNGNYDFYLLKLDINGDIIWNNTYGGEGSQKAYSITKANDGYMVVGDIQLPNSATDAWVLKVDQGGNVLWNKSVGGKDSDSAAVVALSEDGNYLVGGFTFSYGEGNRDNFLFKISNKGNVLWSCTQGNSGYQEAYQVLDTGKNQYIMIGWTDPLNDPSLIGKAQYDFYAVKISPQNTNLNLPILFVALCILVMGFSIVIRRLSKKKNKIFVLK